MEIKIKIEAPGLEGALHTLAQVLGNFEYPVNLPGTEPVEVSVDSEKVAEAVQVTPKEDKPKISLETVRAKMVELSRAGKQPEMKQIITSFGAKKLSDIPEDKYPEVIQKVEELL